MTFESRNSRRRLLQVAGAMIVAAPGLAAAQPRFPTRQMRIVVPFAPGGAADSSARLVAEQWTQRFQQSVIVENRAGASGNVGAQSVARSDPDGYTLLLGFDGTMVINPFVFKNMPFDTVKDFAPVGKIGDVGLLMVANPNVAVRSLKDVIALSKSQSGGLSVGSTGTGSTAHLLIELLKQQTGANLVHVPYRGAAPAVAGTIGGETPLAVVGMAGIPQHIRAGKLKGIAVSSAQRSKLLPDVPTMVESGVADLVLNSWNGILAPAGTPKAIIDLLNAELNAALKQPKVVERLEILGFTPTVGTPQAFADQIDRDLTRYGNVVKTSGISVDG